ncbi:unnamed protein product (macronuclear) [Paramecium tetraurelia]|uniref:Mini antigen n=1 Tax=Paramecium tetraurelia TaxID=5888 RepID=A0BWG0_PARTE|nr:uncharacterized protein GSPATT00032729001 [Paramecium tetraurelia]CAK62877.1 unnamed protein product [Paramecium tetraurelia]|eukprot:XP_001430275.1 hypothetical protein (macronuclear) [Paramecium tetraurelia strain d4-2]
MLKISFLFLLCGFSVFGQDKAIPNVYCACQQIMSQVECNNWNCQWISTTSQAGYCGKVKCEQLNQQQCQNSQHLCYYQESSQQINCFPFDTCEHITLKSGQSCQGANSKCVQSNIDNKCINSGDYCQGLSQSQCTAMQDTQDIYTLTTEGMCFWSVSSCKVVSQCAEIQYESICNKKWLNYACYWSGTSCVSQKCSQFTSQNTCRFVQTTPLSGALTQPCFWNGQTCTNGTADQLTEYTCASNTNYHYRWVPIEPLFGICAQCNLNQYHFPNDCDCTQLLLQSECNNSPNCKWANDQCIKLQCSEYLSQQKCAQIQGCFWNALIIPSLCQPYDNCEEILEKNYSTCIASSIYCPGSKDGHCLSQSGLSTCSELFNNKPIQPSICYNSIGKDGYCTYSNSACQSVSQCSDFQTFELCNQFYRTCIWQKQVCQIKKCEDYYTQSSCSYVYSSINEANINICAWNQDTKKCNIFYNSINYDINSCYIQSGRTHHWSQPRSTIQKGFCLPCKFSHLLNVKSKCECQDFSQQIECIQSFPNCYWDYKTSTCQIQNCSLLTIQGSCILNKNCYWNQTTQNCTGQSVSNSTQSFCSSLLGNTQQECLSQSILCAGSTKTGQCQSSLQQCNDYQEYYQCFGSLGADGLCQWNQNSSSCSGASDCKKILNSTLCNTMLRTCYWDSGTCYTFNCTTLYNLTSSCDYYLNQPNQNYEAQFCNLNGNVCDKTTDLNTRTSQNCYNSTGGIARWDNNIGCGQCYGQLISTIIIILISIL